MHFLITIAYDGSCFYGFQRLNDLKTVQKTLEEALTKINKKMVFIKGAGRTDRGVHANGQRFSCTLDIPITEIGLKRALNSLVNPEIYIKEVKQVDENIHARFSVKKKVYVYKINLGNFQPVLDRYVYQPVYRLDIAKMKKVAKLYLGVHDFHNFVSGSRLKSDAVLYRITFKRERDILSIRFEGKSFYRYMVRNLVGMMLEVGRGKETISKVKEMLIEKRKIEGHTAPACGLYLEEIYY